MRQAQLFPLVRREVALLINGYIDIPEIVPPALGDRSGVCGALVLAEKACGAGDLACAPKGLNTSGGGTHSNN